MDPCWTTGCNGVTIISHGIINDRRGHDGEVHERRLIRVELNCHKADGRVDPLAALQVIHGQNPIDSLCCLAEIGDAALNVGMGHL
jgi:hypothetical protein